MPAHHPTRRWGAAARHAEPTPVDRLRLAAMAGHIAVDRLAARRAALVDLLADGRPHLREEIWRVVSAQLGSDCWGKRPRETLVRDLAVLRRGGLRIAYSRTKGVEGYYLQDPPLARPAGATYDAVNWRQIDAIRELDVAAKNERAFAAADWALRQKRLQLAEAQPAWSAEQVDAEARRLVYGVDEPHP